MPTVTTISINSVVNTAVFVLLLPLVLGSVYFLTMIPARVYIGLSSLAAGLTFAAVGAMLCDDHPISR